MASASCPPVVALIIILVCRPRRRRRTSLGPGSQTPHRRRSCHCPAPPQTRPVATGTSSPPSRPSPSSSSSPEEPWGLGERTCNLRAMALHAPPTPLQLGPLHSLTAGTLIPSPRGTRRMDSLETNPEILARRWEDVGSSGVEDTGPLAPSLPSPGPPRPKSHLARQECSPTNPSTVLHSH